MDRRHYTILLERPHYERQGSLPVFGNPQAAAAYLAEHLAEISRLPAELELLVWVQAADPV